MNLPGTVTDSQLDFDQRTRDEFQGVSTLIIIIIKLVCAFVLASKLKCMEN